MMDWPQPPSWGDLANTVGSFVGGAGSAYAYLSDRRRTRRARRAELLASLHAAAQRHLQHTLPVDEIPVSADWPELLRLLGWQWRRRRRIEAALRRYREATAETRRTSWGMAEYRSQPLVAQALRDLVALTKTPTL